MTRWEIFFATLAVIGAATAASATLYMRVIVIRQTLRADAFQDAYNKAIWDKRDRCRIRAAHETALMRALAADAMAAEHAAALNKQVLEEQ